MVFEFDFDKWARTVYGPLGGADLHFLGPSARHQFLRCKTTASASRGVSVYVPAFAGSLLIAPTHRGMARLS